MVGKFTTNDAAKRASGLGELRRGDAAMHAVSTVVSTGWPFGAAAVSNEVASRAEGDQFAHLRAALGGQAGKDTAPSEALVAAQGVSPGVHSVFRH
jgi:hypothetical protein